MTKATIAMLTSTIPMTIRPTELERRMGRLMRGPDGHVDADGGNDGGDAGGDAGAGGDGNADNADSDKGDKGDQGGSAAGEGDGGGDTASLVGQAAAKARAGKDNDGGDGGEGDAGGDKEDDDKAVDVPEAYDLSGIKVTLKDDKGEDIETDLEIDTALLDMATPHLKEARLNNDQAKALAPLVVGIKERALADQAAEYEAMAASWAKGVKADKELGGKNWGETEHAMGRAFDRFGSPELDTLLEESRLGNHPAVVKFFAGVGKALGEDEGGHRGGGPPATKKDREVVLYPDDAPKP